MKKLAILAALGLAAAASGAEATVFTVTYTGTVSSGSDQSNFFGLGTNLAAVTPDPQFTLQFTVDTAHPADSQSTPQIQNLYGNGQSGKNPILQSSFTLNGKTVYWSNSPDDGYNNSYGQTERYDEYVNGSPNNYDRIHNYSYDDLGNVQSMDYATALIDGVVNEIVDTTDLASPLDYQVQAGDNQSGSFTTTRYDSATKTYSRKVNADLTVAHVVVAVAGVPEPATWAMLIAGFGLTGAAMRRRRAVLATA